MGPKSVTNPLGETLAARGPAPPLPMSPAAINFLASLAFMLVELNAGRLMAWLVGTGLYSWTTVIGVMFAGMSLGNYLGGRLAELPAPRRRLGRLFLGSAVLCFLMLWSVYALALTDADWQRGLPERGYKIPTSVLWVMGWFYAELDRPVRMVLLGALTFVPAAVLMGLLGPITARLALDRAAEASAASPNDTVTSDRRGRAVGQLYAWGAVGSIVGTFAAGFLLVELLGTRGLLASVVILLGGLGWLLERSARAEPSLWSPEARGLWGRWSRLRTGLSGWTEPVTRRCFPVIVFAGGFALALSALPVWWADHLGNMLFLRYPNRPMYATESDYQYVACSITAHEVEVREAAASPSAWGGLVGVSDRTQLTVVDDREYQELLRQRRVVRKLRELRALTLDHLVHGYVWLKRPADQTLGEPFHPAQAVFDPDDLVYSYEHLYAAFTERLERARSDRVGRPLRTLSLGAGSYTFPRYLAARYAKSRHDVVEIDPAVTVASVRMLKLDPTAAVPEPNGQAVPIIRIYHADARNFVEAALVSGRAEEFSYDVIYGDAFNHFSIPFHLTTREFNEQVRRLLRPGGAYIMNTIDSYESLAFLSWMLTTLRQTFPYLYVAAIKPKSAVLTDRVEYQCDRVAFENVTVELMAIDGRVVWSGPAEQVEQLARLASWAVTDLQGRTTNGHVLERAYGKLQLRDSSGRPLLDLTDGEVRAVRFLTDRPIRLIDSSNRVHRGVAVRFIGGRIKLISQTQGLRPEDEPLESEMVLPAEQVCEVREISRLNRDTFVIAAATAPLDVRALGRRREDPRLNNSIGYPTAERTVLLTEDELSRMFARTQAQVFHDDYAPVDVLLLPLFRDE